MQQIVLRSNVINALWPVKDGAGMTGTIPNPQPIK